MAFKIYKKNNYIIVEDTISGKQYQGLAKNVFVYKDAVAETTYDFEGLTYNGLKGVSLNDLIDENNVSFTDEQSFINFYTENTGNFNSGGGSPQLTENELLGIQNANDLSETNPAATLNDILDVYSTTETIVGTWIDGKPIYRKVIDFTIVGTELTIPLTGLNIEIFVDKKINILSPDKKYISDHIVSSGGVNELVVVNCSNATDVDDIYINSYTLNITNASKTAYTPNSNGFLVLEYTKTTD